MGPIWAHMGPYGPIWAHMGPYGPAWARPGPTYPTKPFPKLTLFFCICVRNTYNIKNTYNISEGISDKLAKKKRRYWRKNSEGISEKLAKNQRRY